MPERIQRSRSRGWKLPPRTVCVDRTSRWGNPYKDYPLVESLALYEKRVVEMLQKDPLFFYPLWGKNLACWCRIEDLCHADILLRYFGEAPFGKLKA